MFVGQAIRLDLQSLDASVKILVSPTFVVFRICTHTLYSHRETHRCLWLEMDVIAFSQSFRTGAGGRKFSASLSIIPCSTHTTVCPAYRRAGCDTWPHIFCKMPSSFLGHYLLSRIHAVMRRNHSGNVLAFIEFTFYSNPVIGAKAHCR